MCIIITIMVLLSLLQLLCVRMCRSSMSETVLRNNMYVRMNMPALENFDPLPAINHWFSMRDRRPHKNDKAKEQEWFLGVFDEAGNRRISLPSQPAVGSTCELLQVQMTENEYDDDLSAVNADVSL
jgi:hypothetical protein